MEKPIEHWKNLSLENLSCEWDGVTYFERWRDIEGYERVYKVSDFGRIKSLLRSVFSKTGELHYIQKEKILRAAISTTGYPHVGLGKNGGAKHRKLHILVAKAFIGNIPEGYEINHKTAIDYVHFFLI